MYPAIHKTRVECSLESEQDKSSLCQKLQWFQTYFSNLDEGNTDKAAKRHVPACSAFLIPKSIWPREEPTRKCLSLSVIPPTAA